MHDIPGVPSLWQVDYFDINEVIEDEEGVEPDEPTSSFPMDPPPVPEHVSEASEEVSEMSKHLVTPLADMLPPEFKGKDVREFFPDFRVGEVSLIRLNYKPYSPV